ncbi:MAG: hypothetical protein Q8N18_07345 [Opitutaceae bacterium]|nr:hypothetical protein [Opitutaceae bacterium]
MWPHAATFVKRTFLSLRRVALNRPELPRLRDGFPEDLRRERLLRIVADALGGLDVRLDARAVSAAGHRSERGQKTISVAPAADSQLGLL